MVKCIPADAAAQVPGAAPKVFTRPGTRGLLVEWYLAELGLEAAGYEPVELVTADRKTVLPVNPFGRVPALAHGPLHMFESGAVLMYLGKVYDELFTSGPLQDRAMAIQWIEFAGSTLSQEVFSATEGAQDKLSSTLSVLDTVLKDAASDSVLGGAEVSVADVAVASYLLFLPVQKPGFSFAEWPSLQSYVERMGARPGYKENAAW